MAEVKIQKSREELERSFKTLIFEFMDFMKIKKNGIEYMEKLMRIKNSARKIVDEAEELYIKEVGGI